MIKKSICFSGVILIAWISTIFARTMYTSDITEISVREGRDTSYPVITTLKSNQPVTVLESINGWSRIQSADGKEGWLITSYLTDKMPGSAAAPETARKMDQMALQLKGAGEENERLKKEIQTLKSQLDTSNQALSELRASATENPAGSEEILSLKARLDQISAEAAEKTKKIQFLEQQLAGGGDNASQYKCYVYIFLAGAGVLLLGMMIGSSAKRRRSSLL